MKYSGNFHHSYDNLAAMSVRFSRNFSMLLHSDNQRNEMKRNKFENILFLNSTFFKFQTKLNDQFCN